MNEELIARLEKIAKRHEEGFEAEDKLQGWLNLTRLLVAMYNSDTKFDWVDCMAWAPEGYPSPMMEIRHGEREVSIDFDFDGQSKCFVDGTERDIYEGPGHDPKPILEAIKAYLVEG